jgi:uncharacterized protein
VEKLKKGSAGLMITALLHIQGSWKSGIACNNYAPRGTTGYTGDDRVDDRIEAIREHIRSSYFAKGSHGLDHTERVARLCELIGREEEADMRVLMPAALFHDVARSLEESQGIDHAVEGARLAEEYLASNGYDPALIPRIAHAIRAHRFQSGEEPATPEARILSDADKLDAMGAVGLARTFMHAGECNGEIGDAVGHIHEKLLRLRNLMYTGAASRIADKRHDLLVRFVKSLEDEMDAG